MTEDGTTTPVATVMWKVLGLCLVAIAAFCIVGEANLFPSGGFAGAGFFAFLRGKRKKDPDTLESQNGESPMGERQPDPQQPNLLFDDYQGGTKRYVVRDAEEERQIVPSTRRGKPASDAMDATLLRDAESIDFFDIETDTPAQDAEPRDEFHTLLNRVLLVLKTVLFSHTAAYFWFNREKQQLVLEGVATDSASFFPHKRLPLAEDVLSKVARSGKPQILSNVNPMGETELLRYYESPAGVRAAVVVPVFYRNELQAIEPVGVLVADSTAEDAYGEETVETLGKFTKLVSALIKSYTDKYDLLQDAELLSAIRTMQDRIKSDPTEQTILAALVEEAGRLTGWEHLTVTMFSEEVRTWTVQRVMNAKGGDVYVLPSQVVDIARSIVGEAITSNRVEVVPDLAGDERFRFHHEEVIPREGAFVAVPISSVNRCYGALSLEQRKEGRFSGAEVETLYRLVENAAAALEVGYMNDLVKEFAAVEHLTGMMTKKYFLRRVEEEVQRADDTKAELAYTCLAVDAIDEQVRRFGRQVTDLVYREIVGVIRGSARAYDTVGRQDGPLIGVVLPGMTASDAYLWAEKLRKSVASHVITVGMRTFSVTVSLGVCGLSERMSMRELVTGATQVYNKAAENGGNVVRVF